jgi:Zn-dependent protease
MFLIDLAILAYSVILHEIAHGWVADHLGDPTARLRGRLTLNPVPHIDPVMTIALPLVLTLTGSHFLFGAAKPVPVDPFNFREPKKDMALVAAAGPLTNLLIALILSLILKIFPNNLVVYGVQINVFLAVFNLLPIPPLDGSKVFGLPSYLDRYGMIFIFMAIFFLSPIINAIIYPITNFILGFLLP